jgi:hypothetical protein
MFDRLDERIVANRCSKIFALRLCSNMSIIAKSLDLVTKKTVRSSMCTAVRVLWRTVVKTSSICSYSRFANKHFLHGKMGHLDYRDATSGPT